MQLTPQSENEPARAPGARTADDKLAPPHLHPAIGRRIGNEPKSAKRTCWWLLASNASLQRSQDSF